MNERRVAIVWNPAKIDQLDLAESLSEAGLRATPTWHATAEDDAGQAAAQAAVAAGPELVVVAGGDGTVRAAVETLAGGGVPLAIIPSGTGNLLARNLGIPLGTDAAARVALGGTERRIDVGWATVRDARHAFAVIAGFGVDSRMMVETDEDLKSKTGWLAYVGAVGRALSSADVIEIEMSIDGAPSERVEAHTVMVGNCGTITAGITLLPDAAPDDGVLDALVLSAEGLGGWLDALKTAAWDNGVLRWFQKDPSAASGATTDHLRGTQFALRMEKPVTFQLDGDDFGEVDAAEFEVEAGALLVRAP